jgi:hypothetical protein
MSDDQAKDLESARAQVAVLREALEKVDEIACRSGGGSAGPEPEAPEPINPDGQELSYLARAALASSASSAASYRAEIRKGALEELRHVLLVNDFSGQSWVLRQIDDRLSALTKSEER